MAGDVIVGPWPGSRRDDTGDGLSFRWLSPARNHPSATEERRATVLAAKARCRVCDVPFDPRAKPPAHGVCRECIRDAEANTTPDDPALF